MDPMNTVNNRRKQAGLPPYPPGGGAAEELGLSRTPVMLSQGAIVERLAELEFMEIWLKGLPTRDSVLDSIRLRKAALQNASASRYLRDRERLAMDTELREKVDELLSVGQKILEVLDRR